MKKELILDSWKEISEYLSKDIRTCHRWEKKLGLPVHRYDDTSSRSKVFAYKHEIDEWLQKKAQRDHPGWKIFLQKTRVKVGFSAAAVILLVSLGLYQLNQPSENVPPQENLSLAVIPFDNPEPAGHSDFFSEGFTEGLINSFFRLNTIKIMPFSAVFRYRNSKKSPNQIGNELGVHYILTGNISRNIDKFQLRVELTRIKDQNHIWSQHFEDSLENLLKIRDSICLQVHEKIINGRSGQKSLSDPAFLVDTADYSALENYYIGNFIKNRALNQKSNDPFYFYHNGKHFSGKWDKTSNEMAISYFEKSLALDPYFARAYLGLAECYTHYVNMHWEMKKFWLEEAENKLETAYSLEPELPEYYSLMARVHLLRDVCFNENSRQLAFKIAREGLEKHPYSHQIHSILGQCYFLRFGEDGKEEDLTRALRHKEKCFEWDGRDAANITLAEILMLQWEFNRALDVCNLINLNEKNKLVDTMIGQIYYYTGDLQKSREIFESFDSPLAHRLSALYFLGMIYAQEGRQEEVENTIRQTHIISPEEKRLREREFYLASIYMGLGNKELGYSYLENFLNSPQNLKRFYIYRKYIDLDRNFNAVRSEKRFLNLIKRKEYKL